MPRQPKTCIELAVIFTEKFPAEWNEGLIIALKVKIFEVLQRGEFPIDVERVEVTDFCDEAVYRKKKTRVKI